MEFLKFFKKRIKVVTHSGSFHADDVFACATLSILEKGKVKIIRTRDEKIIKTGKYIVDVGGIYDPTNNKFDHHQKAGAGKRKNGIPYASFGLVWEHFGQELCGSKEAANLIDQKLVQPIDAIDNGVMVAKPVFDDVWPYSISDVVNAYKPSGDKEEKEFYKAFFKILKVAQYLLKKEIERMNFRLESKKAVEEIYTNSLDKRIIIFNKNISWNEALAKHHEPLFAILPNNNGDWRIVAVRDNQNDFKSRKDLPKEWAGLEGGALQKVAGVNDAVFCHKDLFLASAKSKEGAIKLAQIALLEPKT